VQTIQRYREILPQKIQVECTVTQAHRDAGLSLTEVLEFCARDLGVEEPHIAGAGMPPGNPLNPYQPGAGFYNEYIAAAEASMDALLGGGDGPRGRLDAVADVVYRLMHRKPVAVMCPAGIGQVVVDAFGDIYPCWMFAGDLGHAMGNILRDELRGPKALQVIDRIENNSKNRNPICSGCYARGVCSVCVGNNHNSNGRLEDPSPAYCDTVRGTLRVVLERLVAAKPDATAMAGGMAGGLKC
jgi:radical SAM protein with 4Fe4S-binding SPASM domain